MDTAQGLMGLFQCVCQGMGMLVPDRIMTASVDDFRVHFLGETDAFEPGLPPFVQHILADVTRLPAILQDYSRTWGHYAVALEQLSSGDVYLFSDPLGTEPVYFCQGADGQWHWGFRIRSLLPHLARLEIDPRGLDEVFRYRWLAEDHTLIDGIRRLKPGHFAELRAGLPPRVVRYCDIRFAFAETGASFDAAVSETDAALDGYLRRARKKHARVAVFLSGGVDSSLLLAKARDAGFDRLIAVTGHFASYDNPETERARSVARLLDVEHRIVTIEEPDLAAALPVLVESLEAPISYFNNFVRLKLFEAVARDVGAVLVGEGADTMFGEERNAARDAWRFERKRRIIVRLPSVLRERLLSFVTGRTGGLAARTARLLRYDTLEYARHRAAIFPEGTGSGAVSAEDLIPMLSSIRRARVSPFYASYGQGGGGLTALLESAHNMALHTSNRHQYHCYSMIAAQVGLRVAAPFLSTDIKEIGLTLPVELRASDRGPKPVLRALLDRYLPREIVDAPKLDFVTPDAALLSGPLKRWRTILDDRRTRERGLFDQPAVLRMDRDRDRFLILTAVSCELFLREFLDQPVDTIPGGTA